METEQGVITVEVPNLDAVDEDDLATFIEVASEARGNLHMLATYAQYKKEAIQYRAAGNIPSALFLEAECDRIYKRLPEGLRW
jgi:hypothetical protein